MIYRIVSILAGIIVVLLTLRLLVPWMINQQNDGMLILAPIFAISIVTGVILLIAKIFKETEHE